MSPPGFSMNLMSQLQDTLTGITPINYLRFWKRVDKVKAERLTYNYDDNLYCLHYIFFPFWGWFLVPQSDNLVMCWKIRNKLRFSMSVNAFQVDSRNKRLTSMNRIDQFDCVIVILFADFRVVKNSRDHHPCDSRLHWSSAMSKGDSDLIECTRWNYRDNRFLSSTSCQYQGQFLRAGLYRWSLLLSSGMKHMTWVSPHSLISCPAISATHALQNDMHKTSMHTELHNHYMAGTEHPSMCQREMFSSE
jgi:hypothetical protein